ncbi:MAG: hypothetical protein L0J44_09420, partial [Tetragenococcus koreensis]|nr:hypothetical protein [Tetragenococcus koreensis]
NVLYLLENRVVAISSCHGLITNNNLFFLTTVSLNKFFTSRYLSNYLIQQKEGKLTVPSFITKKPPDHYTAR